MTLSCEVLVIGGGPAGSSCARELRRLGIDCHLLDQRAFPRDKVCAGWVTPRVFQSLDLDPDDYAAAGNVLQPIRGFRTGLIGGGAREFDYPGVVSYGIRRREFDHFLLRRAGVPLHLGRPVRGIERTRGGWRVNGEWEARVLVGAGGHACPVARHLGAVMGSRVPVVAAREAELRLPAETWRTLPVAGERPELYFSRDLRGYGWIFRKGDFINVGLGLEPGRDLKERLAEFSAWLEDTGRLPRLEAKAFKGHAYLLHGRGGRPPVSDGALLVGDALGLAWPQSGEGIGPAVESGMLAAEAIAAAGGDYRAARLMTYAERLRDRFGAPRPLHLPPVVKSALAAVLLGSARLTRSLVMDRCFLHRDRGISESF